MSPTIAIVGGGPCGLTLARLLECNGFDYVVYERDETDDASRGGGSLDLHSETGQLAIREGGLFDEFKKHARYDDTTFKITDQHGEILLDVGQGRDAPEIDRFLLRRIFLESIPKDKIRWGHAVTGNKLDEDGVPVLEFSNGSTASGFKLVVGADGAWSKVRPLINQAKPIYSGKYFVESRIYPSSPQYGALATKVGTGTLDALGPYQQMIVQKQGDSSYRIYYGFLAPEDFASNGTVDLSNGEAVRKLLLSKDFFGDWVEEMKDLIRHSDTFRSWALYSLPAESLDWKPVPGVTLIGDAAHVAVPFAGEGVNSAMKDALVLAKKIAEHRTGDGLERAVREYEQDMFPRGRDVITRSMKNGELLFNKEGPHAFIRALTDGSF